MGGFLLYHMFYTKKEHQKRCSFLVYPIEFAPLAARPARQLLIVAFAVIHIVTQPIEAKHFAPAKRLFSRKVRFSLRSVTANAHFMRLLISPLKSIINTFLKGKLVPQILFYNRSFTNKKTPQKGCFFVGAEKRIRTSGPVSPVTRFPIVLLKPLRHLCIYMAL